MSTESIYYGAWVNWSHGKVVGSTITLSPRSGSLLTAFLAIFVTAAGAALWRILAFVVHQSRTRQDPRDGLHHQQQVILRNTSTPSAASWQLLLLVHAWRKLVKRPLWRSLPLVLLALVNLAGFAIAGVFSAEVTKAAGTTVLIRSDNCGNWTLNSTTSAFALSHKTSNDTITAASYARACYGGPPDSIACNLYAKPSLTYTINRNDSCPFASGTCLRSTAAFSLDTGNLSSHTDLGMNAQWKDRITYRRKTTCAPLADAGYITTLNYTDAVNASLGQIHGQPGDVIDFYNFGHATHNNFTYHYNRRAASVGNAYSLGSSDYSSGDVNNTWVPDAALSRDDADISIMFLAANDIRYFGPVHDPIFQATTAIQTLEDNGKNHTLYTSDYFVNPLGCIDQHQFCNPNNNRCTDLNSYSTAVRSAWANLTLNPVQYTFVAVLSLTLYFSTISQSIGGRGSSALRAQESLNGLFSGPLPNDQWMIEVESWFTTGLAKLQQYVVQYAAGPLNVVEGSYISKPTPDDAASQALCRNQKIQSTNKAISFSVLGIIIIMVVGGLLILTNFFLDTIVRLIQRRWNLRRYQLLQWVIEDKLQLQRLAYEEAGMGTWAGGTSSVPVTKPGETFGMPSDTDPYHPRLRTDSLADPTLKPEGTFTSTSENSATGTEDQRLMNYHGDPVQLQEISPVDSRGAIPRA